MLRRMRLFEFHDLGWFPVVLRDGITECLRLYAEQIGLEKVIAPLLAEVVQTTGIRRIVDLCSGSCGPILPVVEWLADTGMPVDVVATDKYPNAVAFRRVESLSGGRVHGCPEAVDATRVPESLSGIRTVFNAFHHFDPDAARAMLGDAGRKRQPIAIFEITDRSTWQALATLPGSFLLMFALVPRMRPRRWAHWVFTYLLPVLPLAFAWDGFVSCLRSYNKRELTEMSRSVPADYVWTFRRAAAPGAPIRLTCFIGIPKQTASARVPTDHRTSIRRERSKTRPSCGNGPLPIIPERTAGACPREGL